MKNFTKPQKAQPTKSIGVGHRKSYIVPTLIRVPDKERDRKYK